MASASSSQITTRLQDSDLDVYLVGPINYNISGTKLPSLRQVLRVFFYLMRVVRLDQHASANLAIREAIIFWEKARIPVSAECWCVQKLLNVYKHWASIKKSIARRSARQITIEEEFKDSLDDLFDISTSTALETMQIQEDKDFLVNQRRKGRPGALVGVDKVLAAKERRKEERLNQHIELREIYSQEQNESVVDEFSIYSKDTSGEEDLEEYDTNRRLDISNTKEKAFIDARLVAALDKCKVSNGFAVHLLTAVISALGLQVSHYAVSRTTIERKRKEYRQEMAKTIKADFHENLLKSSGLVIHWDGKMISELIPKSYLAKVERLPVIVVESRSGIQKLLGVPSSPNSKGESVAKAVFETLKEWDLVDKVEGMCFDTTASNTGKNIGACKVLQNMIGRELLPLACRHHVYEIMLRCAFEVEFGSSKSPEVAIFNRFREARNAGRIDVTKFESGMRDKYIRAAISDDVVNRVINFCRHELTNQQPRADYKKWLQLSIIFLGGFVEKFNFPMPEATSEARWMSKGIYVLEMFLFRKQFVLTAQEKKAARNVSIFIITLYIESWFKCKDGVSAPNQDLHFIKNAIAYSDINKNISAIVSKRFSKHLWYLTEVTIAFAFFDPFVSSEEKKKMVENLSRPANPSIQTKINEDALSNFLQKSLSDFVTEKTLEFFNPFCISLDFVDEDPSEWASLPTYLEGLQIARSLQVVNDNERGVKFMTEYAQILTTNEDQRQFILQCTEQYRKDHPSWRKADLLNTPGGHVD